MLTPDQRSLLTDLRQRDPDGWESREPTDAERQAFASTVARRYGRDVWQTYAATNWDVSTY